PDHRRPSGLRDRGAGRRLEPGDGRDAAVGGAAAGGIPDFPAAVRAEFHAGGHPLTRDILTGIAEAFRTPRSPRRQARAPAPRSPGTAPSAPARPAFDSAARSAEHPAGRAG